MGIENGSLTQEDASGSYALSYSYEYDDVTLSIQSIDWSSSFPYDLRVVIEQAGLPTVETVIRAGRSGRRPKLPNDSYRHDEVLVSVQRSVRQVGR